MRFLVELMGGAGDGAALQVWPPPREGEVFEWAVEVPVDWVDDGDDPLTFDRPVAVYRVTKVDAGRRRALARPLR